MAIAFESASPLASNLRGRHVHEFSDRYPAAHISLRETQVPKSCRLPDIVMRLQRANRGEACGLAPNRNGETEAFFRPLPSRDHHSGRSTIGLRCARQRRETYRGQDIRTVLRSGLVARDRRVAGSKA